MQFSITVLNSATENPIHSADVFLRLGDFEQSSSTRIDGTFSREDSQEVVGQELYCLVKMDGFTNWEITEVLTKNTVDLIVRLKPEAVAVKFSIVDQFKRPVEGATLSAQIDKESIPANPSDGKGNTILHVVPLNEKLVIQYQIVGPVGYAGQIGSIELEGHEDLHASIEIRQTHRLINLWTRDDKGHPIEDVEILLEADGQTVGSGVSKKGGKLLLLFDLRYAETPILFKAKRQGKEIDTGKIPRLGDEYTFTFGSESPTPKVGFWVRFGVGLGKLIKIFFNAVVSIFKTLGNAIGGLFHLLTRRFQKNIDTIEGMKAESKSESISQQCLKCGGKGVIPDPKYHAYGPYMGKSGQIPCPECSKR